MTMDLFMDLCMGTVLASTAIACACGAAVLVAYTIQLIRSLP